MRQHSNPTTSPGCQLLSFSELMPNQKRASRCSFNVYVAQPEIKPGCVLRRSNVNVLESRKLVTGGEVIV